MLDEFGRSIEYLRVSVTDRCDLRCVYCMPEQGVSPCSHDDVLRYEDILRLARIFAGLGIRKIRLTGGEPLVRKNLASLVGGLKAIPGIETVCLTTNGMLLSEQLGGLVNAGLDSVNISLDALDDDVFRRITRFPGAPVVLAAIDDALAAGLSVKINCVPTVLNRDQLVPMAERFLPDKRLALRFIELMPIGLGKTVEGISPKTVQGMMMDRFGPMTPLQQDSLSGPSQYYRVDGYPGRLGFISAVSHSFCQSCNRVRLTSTGFLKTCLQFDEGVELKPLLSERDEVIEDAVRTAILKKPAHHLFTEAVLPDDPYRTHMEKHTMSQIGG